MGQVITMNSTISGTLDRMLITTNTMRLQFLAATDPLPDSSLDPESVLGNVTPLLAPTWLPSADKGTVTTGYIVNCLYPRGAQTYTYSRSLQVYAIMQAQGAKQLLLSLSNSSTDMVDSYGVTYNGTTPVVGPLAYTIEWFSFVQQAFTTDNFIFAAIPWSASDGGAFWYYIQQRSFKQGEIEVTMMTIVNGAVWLDPAVAAGRVGPIGAVRGRRGRQRLCKLHQPQRGGVPGRQHPDPD